MVVALLPTALLAWFLADPVRNQPIVIKIEHFVITSNVSIVAALVAFLVARAALGVAHFRTLLIALGFGCMAGIFAVHGLSTPDVLERGERAQPAGLVVAISGQLALAVAAVFFAVRYTPLAAWLERRIRPRVLTGAVVRALSASRTFCSRKRRSRSSSARRGRRRGGNTTGSCSSRWDWRSVPSSSSSTAGAGSSGSFRRPSSSA